MIWRIVAVGRPALPFAAAGIADYVSRIGHFARVELEFIKAGPQAHAMMISRSAKTYRVFLDERGHQFTSRSFSTAIQTLENRSVSTCSLLVGGADGWLPEERAKADLVWALGKITLQHELALLVALEQIYRAATIKAGTPYHRD